MLNALLHEFARRLHHPSEAAADDLHAMVDASVPADETDTPDAGTTEVVTGSTPTANPLGTGSLTAGK